MKHIKLEATDSHIVLLSTFMLLTIQGKLRNPSGEGVRAISGQAKAKAAKHAANGTNGKKEEEHETAVKEGTAKRNITRRKTSDSDTGNYDSSKKKQGGHGKGEWGLQDSMDHNYSDDEPIDENDPIYDAAEDSKYILSSTGTSQEANADKRGYDPATSKAVYGPMLTKSEFKMQLMECLKEYFDSCDSDEVIRTLEELGCQEYHAEIVKRAISLAMDKTPRERELTSQLLTCLHPTPLSLEDMENGFKTLLDSLDDLSKDVPDAIVSRIRCHQCKRLPFRLFASVHIMFSLLFLLLCVIVIDRPWLLPFWPAP
jgi:hypothetical protein